MSVELEAAELNPTADLLEKAAEVLETKGWCQGEGRNRHGHRCALGALVDASAGNSSAYWQALSAVMFRLNQAVSQWNDEPGRTVDEVTDLFKHLAKDLRNKAVSA